MTACSSSAGGILWGAMAVTLCLSLPTPSHADSPLTSTEFHKHYRDVRAVANARFDDALVAFLLAPNPIDQKAAAINALGWNLGGRDLAGPLLAAIARRKNMPLEQMQLQDLSAEEAFVVGYMRAMDDYLDLTAIAPSAADVRRKRPAELLDHAEQGMPESFTVALIAALVDGEQTLGCETFRAVDRVIRRFPTLRRDMRPRAVDEILEYINLYEDECSKAVSKTAPEFNEIYALARLGPRIAAGTQAGLVLWNLGASSFETHALGICSSVTVWQDAVFADCQKGVYRHDGRVLTKVLASGSKDSPAPEVGPDGKLYVFERELLKRFDSPTAKPVTVRSLHAQYYDATFGTDGTLWGIVFLKSIVHEGPDGPKIYPLNTPAYPGSDPRTLYKGPDNSLWVVDFESGFFRFDPQRGRFEHAADSPLPGSAMLIDAQRNTIWLLGYRGELVTRAPQAGARSIRLGEGYYRDMLLDEDGSLWIGGDTGLVHLKLTEDGPRLSEFKVNPQR